MRKFGLSMAALLFMALLVPSAKADLVFGSTNGKCCFSVDLKQVNANDVLVSVTLTGGATYFANTGSGSNHPGFGFNLANPITASNIQNPSSTLSTFHVGPISTDPNFGSFQYFFDIPGSGTSGKDAGPLTFDVVLTGIKLSDFTKNAAGYYFVADIQDATGATGLSAINTDPTTTGSQVPEPASLMLLGLGLSFAALRLRKKK